MLVILHVNAAFTVAECVAWKKEENPQGESCLLWIFVTPAP